MVTADELAKVSAKLKLSWKVPQRRTDAETHLVERGKPREQVTQILVGALHDGNELIMGASLWLGDRWLPPISDSWTEWRTERGL